MATSEKRQEVLRAMQVRIGPVIKKITSQLQQVSRHVLAFPVSTHASDDETPALDESGKPLFRRKPTSSKETGSKAIIGSKGSKRKHASDQTSNDVSPTHDQADQANAKPSDTSGSGTKSKKKVKKDAKKAGLLSFDHEA
ncbi:hypothetical protein BZG36_00643 [Bifiguratus adelaidae]|uniref:Uncharacterized protein n=1 Tax=Bifiguratus adelaidae TaxID=1938954 RepID=A0A261Y7L9_9FUNG|nr:hypothetical protein BZG36_00643 [Bifiguratus adelaidae]